MTLSDEKAWEAARKKPTPVTDDVNAYIKSLGELNPFQKAQASNIRALSLKIDQNAENKSGASVLSAARAAKDLASLLSLLGTPSGSDAADLFKSFFTEDDRPMTATPRFATPLTEGRRNMVKQADKIAAALGLELFPWQRHAVQLFTELRDDGHWAYSQGVLVVPRQSGKTSLALVLLLLRCLGTPNTHAFFGAQQLKESRQKLLDDWKPLLDQSVFAGRSRQGWRTVASASSSRTARPSNCLSRHRRPPSTVESPMWPGSMRRSPTKIHAPRTPSSLRRSLVPIMAVVRRRGSSARPALRRTVRTCLTR